MFPTKARLFLAVPLLLAALTSPGAAKSPRQPAQAVKANQIPVIDGNVREDPAWLQAPLTGDFRQARPFNGEPATENTEVRILFDETTLYIGVVCYDREPQQIIVSDSRRDSSLDDGDSFRLIIDSFLDEKTGFVFGTNPAAIEYDAQVSNEGQGGLGGGRFQVGAGGGFNVNWDGVWRVATTTDDQGWNAEFAIPFRTLRYGPGAAQTWGINFQRNIRRRNEVAYWAPLERNFDLNRLSDAGELVGVEPPPQHNLQIVPYALAQGHRPAERSQGEDTDLDGGVDLKYSITPSLTLDATYNTDFAQVEVDEQQINLDRFNLFFPEKRPFFLENSGIFSVGSPGEVELFFSRRIGLGDDGETIPINLGARLSGRVGKFNVGLLGMQTEAIASAPETAFGVARVALDLPNRSSVGLLAVTRDESGPLAAGDSADHNSTFAVDGRWGVGQYLTLSGFVAKTDTPGIVDDDIAFQARAGWTSPKWRNIAEFTEVNEGFNPEVGFLQRSAFRKALLLAMRTIRPKNLWGLHELRPHISYTGYWSSIDDFHQTGFLHADNHWEWRSGFELHTGVNFLHEGVEEPFEIFPGIDVPAGKYDDEELQVVVMTNQGAPVSLSMRTQAGGFFGGDRIAITPTLKMRRSDRLTSELIWSYNNIDLPVGSFETSLARLRVSFSITSRVLVQTLLQYNDRDDTVSTNLRLSWLRNANTGLFVVYNEFEEFGSSGLGRPDRSLIVKYSHLIDVLR